MPVRKIPKTYRSLSGQTASRKLNRAAAFESSLERDLLTLLEFSPEVSIYEEQPLTIEYTDEKHHIRTYTPDVLIVYSDEAASSYGITHVLGEVKYRTDLFSHWKELKPKFKAARAFCRKRSWLFRIFTEVEIRTAYLKNAQFLLPYKEYSANQPESERLLETLNHLESASVSQLLDDHAPNETMRLQLIPYIWHLISIGKIHTDLNSPLTMKSQLWMEEAKNYEC